MSTLREAFSGFAFGDVRYLVHAEPVDYLTSPGTATTVDLFLSNRPYIEKTLPSPPVAGPYYYKRFDPRVIAPLNATISMFEPGASGGIVKPVQGTISLANGDGALDYLLNYSWDKKPITIRVKRSLSDDDRVEDHLIVFVGETLGISADESKIDIVVTNVLNELERDFPPNAYAGTGGVEGGDDIKGKPKPITLGRVYNVPPVLVDSTNYIYQVNDGAITSIPAVYEGGVALTLTTDYTVDTTNGRFTLVSAPTGKITADVINDFTLGLYKSTGGALIYRLATHFGGLVDPDDIIVGFFNGAEENAYAMGIYVDSTTTVIAAMNQIVESIGAVVYDQGGQLKLEIPEFPTTAPSTADADPITDNEILQIEVIPTQVYAGVKVKVNYKKNYSPLSESDFAGTPADRDFMLNEWRSVTYTATNATLDVAFESLREIEIYSTINTSGSALTEATRIANFYDRDAKVYKIKMKLNPLYLEIGGAVEVKSSRFGLSSGKPMLILSKFDDLEANEITLEVMG